MDPELAAERAPLPQSGSSSEESADAVACRLELRRDSATAVAEYASELHPGAPYTGEWADARFVLHKARNAVVPSFDDDNARWLLVYTAAVYDEMSAHDELQNQRTDGDTPRRIDVLQKQAEFSASVADYFWKRMTDDAVADPPADGTAATAPAV